MTSSKLTNRFFASSTLLRRAWISHGLLLPCRHTGLVRKDRATVVCLLVAAMIVSCDSGPVYDPIDYAASHRTPETFVAPEWKPIDGDKPSMAKLGQEAMDALGYEEIIKRAEKAGWIKTVRIERAQLPAGKVFIAQGAAVAAGGELVKLFTKYAVWAGISSQADSPVPGPGDAIAVGIIVVGLAHVGYLAMEEILTAQHAQAATASAVPTATATTTTTSPPTTPSNRDRWQCTASCNVQQINQKVDCPARVTGSAGGPNEPAACVEAKRSATQSTPAGCYPRHCQCRCSKR